MSVGESFCYMSCRRGGERTHLGECLLPSAFRSGLIGREPLLMKKRALISCTQPDGGIVSKVYARDPLASLGALHLGVAVYIGDACEASSAVIVIEEFLPSRFVTRYTGNINFYVSFGACKYAAGGGRGFSWPG